MHLRDHPLLSYRGYFMWPPIWVGVGGRGESPQGEIGRLRDVRCYPDKPGRIFLIIDNAGAQYTGCLLFDDTLAWERISAFLRRCRGMLIKEIGSLDMPPVLDLERVYRKNSGHQTWHFCANCSHWPSEDFQEQPMPLASDELCNECKTLQQERNCR
jgi:hypothetical protein